MIPITKLNILGFDGQVYIVQKKRGKYQGQLRFVLKNITNQTKTKITKNFYQTSDNLTTYAPTIDIGIKKYKTFYYPKLTHPEKIQ